MSDISLAYRSNVEEAWKFGERETATVVIGLTDEGEYDEVYLTADSDPFVTASIQNVGEALGVVRVLLKVWPELRQMIGGRMSAKTKAYTEVQIVAARDELSNRDDDVLHFETWLRSCGVDERPYNRARLEMATIARDAVARKLAKMQAAKAEAER